MDAPLTSEYTLSIPPNIQKALDGAYSIYQSSMGNDWYISLFTLGVIVLCGLILYLMPRFVEDISATFATILCVICIAAFIVDRTPELSGGQNYSPGEVDSVIESTIDSAIDSDRTGIRWNVRQFVSSHGTNPSKQCDFFSEQSVVCGGYDPADAIDPETGNRYRVDITPSVNNNGDTSISIDMSVEKPLEQEENQQDK